MPKQCRNKGNDIEAGDDCRMNVIFDEGTESFAGVLVQCPAGHCARDRRAPVLDMEHGRLQSGDSAPGMRRSKLGKQPCQPFTSFESLRGHPQHDRPVYRPIPGPILPPNSWTKLLVYEALSY